jgi:hypothetical protein
MIRFALPLILIALVVWPCSPKPPDNPDGNKPVPNQTNSALSRDTVENGIEVYFYPAYGYRQGTDWVIHIRSWVHEIRDSTATPRTRLGKIRDKAGELATTFACARTEVNALKKRLRDFSAKDINGQQIEIIFDSDPDGQHYPLRPNETNRNPNGLSDPNGLIESKLKLPDATYQKFRNSPNSTKGWLTYHAVSDTGKVLTGKGRIRLIEPKGTSVVTDIDDTIKVSDVPAAKTIVLRNTFCCGFVAASEMAKMYRSWGDDVAFHYVSGGPWQLYGPLYDYLIYDPGAYPEGTFHFNYFPKNILAEDTRRILKRAVADSLFEKMFGSLKGTYLHKQKEIAKLMDNFPGRNFILIGDSGEMDPEVYRWFKENPKYSEQVKEIRIRDVVNDNKINNDRLKGMTVIPAEPIICATQSHYRKVAAMMDWLHRPPYNLAPCDRRRSAARTPCPR